MQSISYRLFKNIILLFPPKVRLHLLYVRRFFKILNLESPTTFTEKIQYKKIFDRHEIYPIMASKVESKIHIQKLCPSLQVPKTLCVFRTVNDINNFNSENKFVHKANHTSQTLNFYTDIKNVDKKQMQKDHSDWLNHDISKTLCEFSYEGIPKVSFAEEFLDFNGNSPDDYKFFVFHGVVKFIQVDYDRFTNHTRNIYKADWEFLDFEYSHKNKKPVPAVPHFIKDMINYAEKIASGHDFLRVDLYYHNEMIYFGECTFYPGSGFEKFPTQELDEYFGSFWLSFHNPSCRY